MIELFRTLARRRSRLVIDIAGLALGLATFLALALVARYELGWDRAYPQPASLWRLSFQVDWGTGTPTNLPGLPREIAIAIKQRQPDILITGDTSSAMMVSTQFVPDRSGTNESIHVVEPGFLDMFGLKLLAGDPALALTTPSGIILSQDMARRYFPNTSPLGHTINLTGRDKHETHIVTGVLANLPRNLSVRPDFIVAARPFTEFAKISDQGVSFSETGWFRADTPAARDRVLAEAQAAFLASNLSRINDGFFAHRTRFRATPITEVHFGDSGVAPDGASRGVMLSLLTIGLLALVAAGINHINLAVAQAMGYAREIAIRKALGATRLRLILRYLARGVGIAAASALPGLALTEAAVPLIASASGWPITLDPAWSLPLLGIAVLVLGIGAGLYPALVMASFPVAKTLASVRMPAQGRLGARLRTALVGVQFAFAVTLGICALVVSAEGLHLRDADRGLQVQGLVSVTKRGDDITDTHEAAILSFLRAMPGVTSATLSDQGLGEVRGSRFFSRAGGETGSLNLAIQAIDPSFLTTMGGTLLAGRLGDPARTDDCIPGQGSGMARNVVIDSVALQRLGFADPQAAIGKRLPFKTDQYTPPMTIIGVMRTMRYGSGRDPEPGTIYSMRNSHLTGAVFALRAAPGALPDVLRQLRAAWPGLAPGLTFAARPATDLFDDATRQDVARGKLLGLGSVSSIAIACLGLFGLASLNVASRTYEIGIRKTLGASTSRIVGLLLGQFLRPVLIASLVAWPLSFVLMRDWLAGFTDRIALSPVYFLAVTIAAAALCCVVVLGRSAGLVRVSAAEALRAQ